jgi:hypothetical protein
MSVVAVKSAHGKVSYSEVSADTNPVVPPLRRELSCGTATYSRGRYAIRVNHRYRPPSCSDAREVVQQYFDSFDANETPSDRSVVAGSGETWRCSFARNGSVAAGTAFRVTCALRNKDTIEGFYRGA